MTSKIKRAQLHSAVDALEAFVIDQHRQMLAAIVELRGQIDHGTRGHYAAGCRHPDCVEANRVYDAERRKRKRQEVIERIETEYAQLEQKLFD